MRQPTIPVDLLCVVHAQNMQYPTQVYRFFKEIKAQYLGFLPRVLLPSGCNAVHASSTPIFYCQQDAPRPNDQDQPLPEAGARHERTL